MEENSEYCTGQDFQVVFVTDTFRLWQCKACAYEFSQRPVSDETPSFPVYHPKPIPTRFVVTDKEALYKQVVRDAIEQMIERREKRLSQLRSTYPRDLETIGKVEHGVMTLLELQHNLHLCDCPSASSKETDDESPDLPEEQREQIAALIKRLDDLSAGKIENCIHCQMPFTKLAKHGRCVYAYPCGHRQYQGDLPEKWRPKKKIHPYFQDQLDEERKRNEPE